MKQIVVRIAGEGVVTKSLADDAKEGTLLEGRTNWALRRGSVTVSDRELETVTVSEDHIYSLSPKPKAA